MPTQISMYGACQNEFDDEVVQKDTNFYLNGSYAPHSPYPQHFYSHEEINNLCALAFLKAQMGPERFAQFYRQLHMAKWGVAADCLKNLYEKSFEDLESWIVHNEKLSKFQALQLWQSYCDRKYLHKKQKVAGRIHIQEEYDRREKKIVENQKAEQKIKSAKEQHDKKLIFCNQNVPDTLWHLRDKALQNSELAHYKKHEQKYILDAQTCGYLYAKNIDYHEYEHCCGTSLQQEYHKEMCDLLTQAAQIDAKLVYNSHLVNQGCLFVDAAHESNTLHTAEHKKRNDVVEALYCVAHRLVCGVQDICNRPQEYVKAMISGVVESGCDFVHMFRHPIDTVAGLGSIVFYVLETSAISQAALYHPSKQNLVNLQKRTELIVYGLQKLQQHVAAMDGPDRVKAITKFGADFYVPGKITKAALGMFGVVCVQAKEMRTIEGVASMFGDDAAVSQAVQSAAEIEQGVAEQILNEFIQAETQIAKANRVVRSLRIVVDEIQSLGGIIPFDRVDLLNEAKAVMAQVMETVNGVIDKKLIKDLGSRVVVKNGSRVQENMNIKHVLQFEWRFEKSKKAGGYVLDITGGHLAGGCEQLEKFGIVKIINKKLLSTGAIEYSMENLATKRQFIKTTFPKDWDSKKIIEAAWKIYESGYDKSLDEVCYKVGAFEGFNMSIILQYITKTSNKSIDVCNVVTVLPYVNSRLI